MTTEDLLNYELDHKKAGNAYACVEIIDADWVRITSKYCDPDNRNRAWLAAMSQLSVFEISPGTDPEGKPYPREKKKLTDDELSKLQPIRDSITTGKTKVIGTHIVPVKGPTTATLV